LILYLEENLNYVDQRIKNELPNVRLFKPEGTYLLWLSFKKYGFEGRELERLLINKAKVALDPGIWFGELYSSYARLNIGCSRELLKEALDRIVLLFEEIPI
jgi:cystathionine beta-lyase